MLLGESRPPHHRRKSGVNVITCARHSFGDSASTVKPLSRIGCLCFLGAARSVNERIVRYRGRVQ